MLIPVVRVIMSNSSFSEPVSDEMLSAYVDGELSPSEVLAVERWLKSSPSSRQKVAEFRRLSGLLQDLPEEELPEEFASQVMAQAERQMLLPAQRMLAMPSLARTVRFWAVSVGLPAAAACLLIAIQWNQQKAVQEVADVGFRPLPKAIGDRDRTAMEPADVVPDGRDDSHRSSEVAQAKSLIPDTATSGASLPDSPPPAVSGVAGTSNGLESTKGTRETADGRPPKNESIATVLDQIKELNDSGRIPVVRILVVDRQDGLEVLQVMLDGQKIARDRSSEIGQTPGESSSDQRALFVVASAKELTSALKALEAKSDAIGSWTLSDPVDLARFDQNSRERMTEVMALVAGAKLEPPSGMAAGAAAAVTSSSEQEIASNDTPSRRPSNRRTTPKKNAVASRGDSTPERATSPDREGVGLADVPLSRPGRRSAPTPGRQVLVTMDNGFPPAQIGSARNDSPSTRSQATEAPEADATGIRSASIDRQPPMRVLFVVERQAVPPAAAPPAKESPGGGAA
jgi:hypothetical protein